MFLTQGSIGCVILRNGRKGIAKPGKPHTHTHTHSALGRGNVKEKAGKIGWGQLLEPWNSRREIHSQFGGHREPVTALE